MPRINVLQTEDKKPTQTNTTQNTKTQTVTVGGRTITVNAPTQNTSTQSQPRTNSNPTVGGRTITQKNVAITNKPVSQTPKQTAKQTSSPSMYDTKRGQGSYQNKYTQQDVDRLDYELNDMIQNDPYANEDVMYKDMWSEEKQKGFQEYNQKVNDKATEFKAAQAEVAIDKKAQDANKDGIIKDEDMFTVNGDKVELINFAEQAAKEKANNDEIKKKIAEYETERDKYSPTVENAQIIGDFNAKIAVLRQQLGESDAILSDLNNKGKYQEALISKAALQQAKANKDDEAINEIYKMDASYDDPFIQRRMENIAKIGVDMVAGVANVVDIARDLGGEALAQAWEKEAEELRANGTINDEQFNSAIEMAKKYAEFDANDPRNFSTQMRQNANQIAYAIQNGEDGVASFIGQGIDSTANFLVQFMLLGSTGSLVMMGTQSGTQKYFDNLAKGYSQGTAFLNGLATGLASYFTEKIGMDNFAELLTGTGGKRMMAQVLNGIAKGNNAEWLALARAISSQGIAEFSEEILEGNADYILDSLMAKYGGGEPIEYNPGDIFYSGLIGGFSGLLMGVAGAGPTVNFICNTREQYNNLKADMGAYADIYREALAKGDTPNIAHMKNVLDAGLAALNTYEEKTQMPGIEFLSEQADPSMDKNGEKQVLTEALRPNVDSEVQRSLQKQALEENIMRTANDFLAMKGVDMDAGEFVQLNAEQRQHMMENVEKINSAFPNANISYTTSIEDNAVVIKMKGKTPTIVVNPNGQTSAVVSAVHEVIHTLEGSPEYKSLFDMVFPTVEDFKKKFNELSADRYSGDDFGTVRKEALTVALTEDMMGDEGAQKFIDHMAKYNTSAAYKFLYNLREATGLFRDNSVLGRIEAKLTEALSKQDLVYLADGVSFSTKGGSYNDRTKSLFKNDNYDRISGKGSLPLTNTYWKGDKLIAEQPQWIRDMKMPVAPHLVALNAVWHSQYDVNDATTNKYKTYRHTAETGPAGTEAAPKNPIDRTVVENFDVLYQNPAAVYKNGNRFEILAKATDTKGYPIIIFVYPASDHYKTTFLSTDMRLTRSSAYYSSTFFGKNNVASVKTYLEKLGDPVWVSPEIKKEGILTYAVMLQSHSLHKTFVDSSIAHIFKNASNVNFGDVEVEYSKTSKDDYGYHYGAPTFDYTRKSERLSSRSGRGTGAFGTGTYFFGDGRFKSSYMTDKGKTEHKVDFSNYNLFRPKTTEEGYALHDALKSFDDAYRYVDTNSISEYLNGLEEVRDDMLAFVGEEEDDPNRPQINADDLDPDAPDFWTQYEKRAKEFERAYDEYEANRDVPDYDKLSPEDDEYSFFVNRLIEAGMDEDEAQDLFNRNADENGDVDLRSVAGELVHYYLDYNDLDVDSDIPQSIKGRIKLQSAQNKIEELAKSFGVKPYELSYIVKNAMLDSLAESTRPDFNEAMYDSVGTKVMKALGYEGIDVRNMEGLDNSTYGSVIYDLNPATVQYSKRSGTNATINKEYSDDFKELQASSQEIVRRESWDDKSRYTDANLPERLSEVLRNELESRNYSNGNPDGLLENTGEYEILKDVDGQTFHDVFEIVRAHLPFGECVDLHPVETNDDWTGYNDTTNYLSTDGLSGFSITKDGDLISVFNFNDKKKGFLRSIAPFIREHAKSLDCYVIDKAFSGSKTDLQQMYHDIFGFETREVVDYDYQYDHDGIGKRYGDPQIAFMYNTRLENAQTEELTVDDDTLPVTKKIPDAKDMANKDVAQVLKEMPKPEGKENILHRAKLLAQRCLVDRYSAVNDIAKEYKNPKLIHLTDKVMRSSAMANNAIYSGIFDSEGKTKIGKSLTEIMGQIPEDSKQLFYEYMYHYRNIDDMSMVERFGEGYEDRPVFGESVTAEDSQDRVEQIEKEHPEFKQWAEDLWEMNRQLLKMRMDAGIISQETYDKFTTERPHYVKIARENKSSSGATVLNPNDIKKFKGSTKNILPLDETMRNHILSTYRVCNNNELNSEIIQTVGGEEVFDPDNMDDLIESEFNPLGEDQNSKRLYAYKDGKKYSIPIGEELYQSLAAKTPNNAVTKVLDNTVAKMSNWRKSLLTSKNPLFSLFSNPIKDFQDAIRNTKYLSKYPGSLIEAVHQIITNGEFSQQYDNLGIRSSQYMGQDMADALRKMESDKGLKKFWNNLAELGENIEKAPRLAEFIAALKSGKSVDEAAYDAAEVTTNFKRGGTTAKTMDKYGFTFLNASIQGFDKQVRNAQKDIETIKKNGVKGAISVMAQLTLAGGIPLRMLLDWLWKDDDEYEELSDYVKNNYYIVGKANGRFIRIPKGRVAAFYQTVLDNIDKTVKKQVNAWDALLDDWQSFNDNVAPNNFMDNNLFSPLTQVATGKTWYGEDLIPARLQDIPDYEQYDESTDALSIAIGQLSKKVADKVGSDSLQISPYEFNYLLDQYTGIIGDVLIPATSLKTGVGIDNPLAKGVATAVLDKFTSDPILKNQNVTSFYDLKGVIDTRAAGSTATEEEKLASKYLGTVGSAMGKLYGEKRAIQMDKTLSNKEKLEKTREIQTQINDLAREALANYDNIDKTEKYASIGGVQYYKDDNGEWVKPTKTALEKLNNAGLDEEDRGKYFDTYSKVNDIRKTIKSQTPEGQTADYRKATIDAINNSGMSDKGKNTMFDSYYSSKAVDHINKMELTDKQKYDLKVANKMADGEKDANGKTISNSKARATAEAYKKLGLLEDVLKYIKDNNVSPSELGLSKTVYKELTGGASYSTAYAKSMSKKSSSKSSKKASKSSTPKVKVGGSTGKKQAILTNPVKSTLNNYLNAYSNVFRGSTAKGSTGNATVTCPRCHNQVSSATGRCPICGANL